MPVSQAPNGKWRIGNGPGIYKTKAAAERAYRGYLAHQGRKYGKGGKKGEKS